VPILKNDGVKVNGKDDNPYMKWKIKNVPNHQPDNDRYTITYNIHNICIHTYVTMYDKKMFETTNQ